MKIILTPADFPKGVPIEHVEKALDYCFRIEMRRDPNGRYAARFLNDGREAAYVLVGPIEVELVNPDEAKPKRRVRT